MAESPDRLMSFAFIHRNHLFRMVLGDPGPDFLGRMIHDVEMEGWLIYFTDAVTLSRVSAPDVSFIV